MSKDFLTIYNPFQLGETFIFGKNFMKYGFSEKYETPIKNHLVRKLSVVSNVPLIAECTCQKNTPYLSPF
jgi:hypothetical protein